MVGVFVVVDCRSMAEIETPNARNSCIDMDKTELAALRSLLGMSIMARVFVEVNSIELEVPRRAKIISITKNGVVASINVRQKTNTPILIIEMMVKSL
jgi:hypothetical protein